MPAVWRDADVDSGKYAVMPWAAQRYCQGSATCPHRAGSCPVHKPRTDQGWQNKAGTNSKRIRGRELQVLRETLFMQEPICRMCKVQGATIRDHIIPLAEGGTEDRDNIQPLCQDCSDKKTQAEARRGRSR